MHLAGSIVMVLVVLTVVGTFLSDILLVRIDPQSWMPCTDGIRPVWNEARAGEHTGQGVNAFSMRAPARAR